LLAHRWANPPGQELAGREVKFLTSQSPLEVFLCAHGASSENQVDP
jgi:hypothetical protein